MKIAVFQQLHPVADSDGTVTVVWALDTNGNIWKRHWDPYASEENWGDWEQFDMPEQEPPLTPWEAMLEAQERLRAEGRDIQVIEHGDPGEAPQGHTPEEGEMEPRPLRSDEIAPATIGMVQTRTWRFGRWVDDETVTRST